MSDTTTIATATDPIGGEPTTRVLSVTGFTVLHGSAYVDVIFARDRFNERDRAARVPLSSLIVWAVTA